MSMSNIIDCEDCGLVVRGEEQAYNCCGNCGGKAYECVIGDVSSKRLVGALIAALEGEKDKQFVVNVIEQVESQEHDCE